jgi:hypothetical protein
VARGFQLARWLARRLVAGRWVLRRGRLSHEQRVLWLWHSTPGELATAPASPDPGPPRHWHRAAGVGEGGRLGTGFWGLPARAFYFVS